MTSFLNTQRTKRAKRRGGNRYERWLKAREADLKFLESLSWHSDTPPEK